MADQRDAAAGVAENGERGKGGGRGRDSKERGSWVESGRKRKWGREEGMIELEREIG